MWGWFGAVRRTPSPIPRFPRWLSIWTDSRRRLRRTPRELTLRSPRSASARAARRCPRRRCARSNSPTRRPFAARPIAGARVCGVMTAVGADPAAGMKYAKIIGEKEKAVESVKFDFLGVYRPAVILGNSNTPGVLGYVMPLLHWAMPSKYHSIHKNDLARAMVAQSEQAFLAIARGNAPKEATVKILEYKEMEPFFVKGESDEP